MLSLLLPSWLRLAMMCLPPQPDCCALLSAVKMSDIHSRSKGTTNMCVCVRVCARYRHISVLILNKSKAEWMRLFCKNANFRRRVIRAAHSPRIIVFPSGILTNLLQIWRAPRHQTSSGFVEELGSLCLICARGSLVHTPPPPQSKLRTHAFVLRDI